METKVSKALKANHNVQHIHRRTLNSSFVDEDDDEWDEEEVDEEIMELREVLERSKYTISYLEESGDSLDQEDNEMIKVREQERGGGRDGVKGGERTRGR